MLGRRLLMTSSGPADPYWANVVSLFTGRGTNGSKPSSDSKGNGLTWGGGGDQSIKTDRYYWAQYGSSYHGDGGGAVTVAASASLSGAFTIDGFFYLDNLVSRMGIIGTDNINGAGTGLAILARSNTDGVDPKKIQILGNGGLNIRGTTDITTGAWHYLYVGRTGTTLNVYVDNNLEITTTTSTTFSVTSGQFFLGAINDAGVNNPLAGNLTDMRVTNSVYRTPAGTAPTYPAPTH